MMQKRQSISPQQLPLLSSVPNPIQLTSRRKQRQIKAKKPALAKLSKPELLLMVETTMREMLLLEKTRQQYAMWFERHGDDRKPGTIAWRQTELTKTNKQMSHRKQEFADAAALLVSMGMPIEEIIHVGFMAIAETLLGGEVAKKKEGQD